MGDYSETQQRGPLQAEARTTSARLRRHLPALLGAIFVLYAGLRVVDLYTDFEVIGFPDSEDYLAKADWPVFSGGTVAGLYDGAAAWLKRGRSPVVPLLYKLLGKTPAAIATFQLLLSLASWGLLALFVSRAVGPPLLRLGAFMVLLLFSLHEQIVIWDRFLLSDSIAISLFALFIASWLWLLEEWHWGKAALVVLVGGLWTFTRDTNAWEIAMLAGFLIVVALWWRSPRYLLIGVAFALCFLGNEASQNSAQRWVTPFVNVLGKRVLPDPDRTEYFAGHGMPVTPAVMQLSGQLAWSQDLFYYNSPDLEGFREWVETRGKSTYLRFLLSHPDYAFLAPFREPDYFVDPQLEYFFAKTPQHSPLLPAPVAQAVYPTAGLFLLWVPALLVATGFLVAAPARRAIWLVPFLLVLSAYPHAAIAWHGDANGTERHALLAGIQLRLGLWLILLLAADGLLRHPGRKKARRR